MYLNILKKDLKRKKTMNVILLIFVILSAMFMASSVNNILAVTNGLDFFFKKANMSDYIILEVGIENSELDKTVTDLSSVSECRKEPQLMGYSSDIKVVDADAETTNNTPIYVSIDNAQINYFDQNNQVITEVEEGKVYISSSFASDNNLKIGDDIVITIGEKSVELEYLGKAKDAVFGSSGFGNPRFIMNNEDYQHLYNDEKINERLANVYYINTTDVSQVKEAISGLAGITLNEPVSTIEFTYIMDMFAVVLILVVSVFLIIISVVVLKHTIGFTIAEEFREIGVMKAIGIKNSSIRALYLIKYLAITVIGSLIGFGFSASFSNIMFQSVATSIYLDSDNNILISLLCTLSIIGFTMFFCWISTSKIKKLTPIDAVRNGQTGERFRKKSLMYLSKSKLGSNAFLAVNDIISAPKKYSVITSVFALLIMLVMLLANTANTLKSETCLTLLGCIKSDAYLSVQQLGNKSFDDIEKILDDNNMSGLARQEKVYSIGAEINGKKTTLCFQHSAGTNAKDYVYGEGVAPENENEISIAYAVVKELGINIGDEITLLVNGEEKECIVTAFHQSMMQLGKANRLHESFDVSSFDSTSMLDYQIDFDDELTQEEIDERIEKLKDILDTKKVMNTADFARSATGAYDIMIACKNMVLIIVLAIVVLIAVLMERSFISAEKAEIALMKAIGFPNKSIIGYHTIRFAMVAFVASLIVAVLCLPATKLIIDPIFVAMGAIGGIGYEIAFTEVFLLYPAILVAVTIISVFFTSIYTNTIKSSDASNIE